MGLLPQLHWYLATFITMTHTGSGLYYHCDIETMPNMILTLHAVCITTIMTSISGHICYNGPY